MKTALLSLFAACLIVALSSSAMAAGPPMIFSNDFVPLGEGSSYFELQMDLFAPGGHIFSTEEQGPQLSLQGFFGIDGTETTLVGAEYSLSDFVYGKLFYLEEADLVDLQGGYLWEDLGIFAAIDYFTDGDDGTYVVAGGYRFDLGGGSYAALSLDYFGGDYGESFAVEAVVKYFADGLKLSGQLRVDEDGNYMIHGKANLAAGDHLVWGGGLTWYDSDSYMVFAGLTWTGENGVFDGIVNVDDGGYIIYNLSYLQNFSDVLAVGLSYLDGDFLSDGLVMLKGQYQLGEGAMTFSYTTSAGGGGGATLGLGYEKSL